MVHISLILWMSGNLEMHLGHCEQFIYREFGFVVYFQRILIYIFCFSSVGSNSKSFYPVVRNLKLYLVFRVIWNACSLSQTCIFQGSARDLRTSLYVDFGTSPFVALSFPWFHLVGSLWTLSSRSSCQVWVWFLSKFCYLTMF